MSNRWQGTDDKTVPYIQTMRYSLGVEVRGDDPSVQWIVPESGVKLESEY